MAFAHVVAGPVTVSFNGEELGYTRDGADIRYEARWGDVFSDDYGGAGGAPADTQILGMTGSVSLELTKYNVVNVQKLNAFGIAGDGQSLPVPLGTLMRAEGQSGTLLLSGTNKVYSFPIAFPREPQSLNAGTKFTTYLIQFEFWITDVGDRSFVSIS